MEEGEKDIEMGNTGTKENADKSQADRGNGQGTSSYLCCSDNENEKDDTSSQATFRDTTNDKFPVDEDDLGDHEDEMRQINMNMNNEILGYKMSLEPQISNKNDEDNENNVDCFDINSEFLKIIDQAGRSHKRGNGGDSSRVLDFEEITNGGKNIMKDDSFEDPIMNGVGGGKIGAPLDSDITILHNVEEFWEANSESEDEDYLDKNAKHSLDQISFEKLKKKVYKDFEVTLIHRYSSALDILASYIKYHVIIYTEASYYCNFKLNLFMVPAILFSTICSVITGITHNRNDMAIIVSSLNGFIAFLLAIINYLKLDASAEAHKISAYQYSKLKNYIEFSSGEILLFQDPIITNKNFISEQIKMWERNNQGSFSNDQSYNIERNKKFKEYQKYKSHLEKKLIDTIQNKIFEIKKSLKNIEDNNNFILPKHINRRYYNIYNINVFSYIKSVENYKLILLNDLRNVKNEIRFYRTLEEKQITEELMDKIKKLYNRKNSILTEFLELNKGFMLIDAMFQQEIKNINIRKKYWLIFKFQGFVKMMLRCCCCKDSKINILPVGYKHCTHVGFVDEDGRYLLDKVLRFNNVLTLIE